MGKLPTLWIKKTLMMADTRDNAGEENSAIFMKNVSNIGSLNINNSGQVTNIQGGQYNYNNSTTIPKAKNQTNDENEQQNYNEFSERKPSQNGIFLFLFLLMNYVDWLRQCLI